MEGDITEENQNFKASNNVSECRYDRSNRQLEDQKSMCSREIICEDAKPSEKESWVSGEDSSKEEKGAEEDCISIEEENAKIVLEVGEIESTKHSREGLAPEDEANSISRKNSLKNKDHLEMSKTKYEGICDMGDSSELIFRANESSSEKSAARVKEKMSVGSLRLMLEKRVETVERLLEENVEKYPWLQPIETWIVDHRRSSPPSVLYEPLDRRGYDSDGEVKSKFREKRSGSPKIECKISKVGQESKSECKMMDHLKRLRRGGSPKPDRGQVFEKNVENASKVEKAVIDCFKGFRKVGFSKDEDKMEVSEEKIDPTTSYPGNKSFLYPYDAKSRICPEISDSSKNRNDLRRSSSPSFDVDPRETFEMKQQQGQDFLEKLKEGFKEKKEELYRYFQRTSRLADVNRKLKSQIWSSVVTIVLVEAKNLLPMDIEGLSDPYVKFRLGTEKYKSKVINKTLNPIWLEQFDLHLYEDPYLGQELEMTVWDRDKSHQDNLMGRAIIDLAILERETTHRLWRDLEDGAGSIFLLLTISGTTANETISDLAAHEETPQERARLDQRYSFANTLQRPRDVGHLTVKVYRAQGLVAADLGGKSDPFCVLELVNARLQTQTEYKTLAPNWQKIFTFNVKDINSVLEVTVYDEDRDHKVEFLGKVAIPLLRIRNGEKRWYALKDKKLRGRAKGNSPQILLEMTVVWNVLRACIRTLNPREKKYMEPEMKFKRQVFLRNVLRLKAIIVFFIDMGKYVQSCWEWESKTRSIVALVLFVLGCYYFEPFMIPAAALLILFRYYVVAVVTGVPLSYQSNVNLQESTDLPFDDCPPTPGDDDDDEDDKDKEEKKSLKERLQAIQEVTQTVQNSIGYIASLGERIKNMFNFTVPYLSYLAIVLVVLGAAVLYFIPVRYLILVWGVNKFSRKILRPHTVPNNELLDLLSRVPDDEELLNYRELKPLPTADCEKGGSTPSPTGIAARREQRRKHKVA